MGVVALLLAGGRGRRFGADKLMHALPGGEPMVLAAWRHLVAAGADRNLALIPPGREALRALLDDAGVPVEVCERAPLGMGETLACGVRAVPDATGWVVALGDMPFIDPATIARVIARLRDGDDIVVPRWRGRRGHPVGFGARFGGDLMALRGDTGARHLLREYGEQVTWVDVDDHGIILDVDTPDDLAAALST